MPRNYQAKKSYKAKGAWTPEKKEAFLHVLKTGISMAGAARMVGMSHGFIYDLKAKDPEFSAAIDSAREAGSDRMEDVLLDIGKRQKNVTALIFLLKGRRPELYRDNARLDLTNSDGSMAGLFAEAMMLDGDTRADGKHETH